MAEPTASDLSKCDDEIPLLGISREFDFGQFIELFDSTEDPLDPTRPNLARIVIQPSSTLASERAPGFTVSQIPFNQLPSFTEPFQVKRFEKNGPKLAPTSSNPQTSTHELEVHLFDLLEHGPGAKSVPVALEVEDPEAFFESGIIDIGRKKYEVTVDRKIRNAMRQGLSCTTWAKPTSGKGKVPVRLSLPFQKIELSSESLAEILAGKDLKSAGLSGAFPVLTTTAIRKLLSGGGVLTYARGPKSRTNRLELIPPSSRQVPMANRFQIVDLAAFIAAPFVLSKEGARIEVELTPPNVQELISIGRTEVDIDGPIELAVSDNENAPESKSYIQVRQKLQRVYGGAIPLKPFGVPWEELIRLGEKLETKAYVSSKTVQSDGLLGYDEEDGEIGPVVPFMPMPRIDDSMTKKVQPRLPTGTGLPVAVFVPWKQTWLLKGFSRGNLLNTIALAPQEEITMQIFNWERRSRTLEQSAETDISQQTDITLLAFTLN